jgi:signal transduction histidine kinase
MAEIKQRESWEGELGHTKRDGQRIVVASHWTTLRDASGDAKGWLEINTDVTSRKVAEGATRRLSGRILTLQDEERRRIARELHDSLGQYLVALKINLEALSASGGVPAHVVAESSKILEQCITETRTISHLLHPPLLDESGLNSAVQWYVEGFSRRSGIPVRFENSADLPRVNSDLEIALFRAIQESLTNIHRHSGASSVEIGLRRSGEEVCLEIRDNGRGMKAEQLARIMQGFSDVGVGLAGMRERVRQLGGSVQIESNGGGTVVRVTAPLREKAADSSGSRRDAADWRIA